MQQWGCPKEVADRARSQVQSTGDCDEQEEASNNDHTGWSVDDCTRSNLITTVAALWLHGTVGGLVSWFPTAIAPICFLSRTLTDHIHISGCLPWALQNQSLKSAKRADQVLGKSLTGQDSSSTLGGAWGCENSSYYANLNHSQANPCKWEWHLERSHSGRS